MNQWYDEGLRQFGLGNISWRRGGSDIKALLVDTSVYAVDPIGHKTLADIPSSARIASTRPPLIDAAAGGALDANNIRFTGLAGAAAGAIVLYKDDGAAEDSPLLIYIDDAIGLPIPFGVREVNVAWDNGQNKVARL